MVFGLQHDTYLVRFSFKCFLIIVSQKDLLEDPVLRRHWARVKGALMMLIRNSTNNSAKFESFLYKSNEHNYTEVSPPTILQE